MFDVAVIGAGMAGLTCAQQLSQAGYSVVVVEKSRGVGGRVATRRLHGTCADHGTRYLEPKGYLQDLVQVLSDRHVLQLWTDTVYERLPEQPQLQPSTHPLYVAPAGMSAVAKFLAANLEIRLNRRVQAIAPTEGGWCLTLEPAPDSVGATSIDSDDLKLTAGAVVFAIPAPQALSLLETLASVPTFLHNLRSVEFNPCFSVIAGYACSHPEPTWKAVTFLDNSDLAWIGWDSSKRHVDPLVFVAQSSSDFAKLHLETHDLNSVGYKLLHAAQHLLPWLNQPDWIQVHRWRYAFPSRPWHETYLSAGTDPPLVCCGDWCGGGDVESAMLSGLAAADQVNRQLQQRVLPGASFLTLGNFRA